jgi:hypothetical protein
VARGQLPQGEDPLSPPLVLRRDDIGFGRLIVDDHGVTRARLIRRQSLAWDEIRDYRLTIEMRGARIEVLYLVDIVNAALFIRDFIRGMRGKHSYRVGLELIGEHERVFFNWRFKGVAMAIARVLDRIAEPLAQPARDTLARDRIVSFGPLTLSADAVQWADKPPLAHASVEAIELFNSSPVRLRVMTRDKTWPYAQAPLAHIPNVCAVIELAGTLGYRVRGLELLTSVGR